MSFNSRRSPVVSHRGIVAASQPLAVAAGIEVLSRGGNAADAAVAVAAALNVTEPTSTGIGGDCFALYYEATHGKVYALNASGRAPKALTLERLVKEGFGQGLPSLHPYTITVPGACAGWCDLLDRFGTLSLPEVLAPAIHLAEEGFPVAPITAYFWQRGAERVLRQAPGGLELTLDGRGPAPGEIFRNPGLARTFKLIAEKGREAFYQGEIAEAIVHVVQQAGGCLSLEDLAEHKSTWETPMSTLYRGYRVWEPPPNAQGLAALLALNLLEGYDLSELPALSTPRLHLEIEAMRLAFADARWYVADPSFVSIPIPQLLSKEYAAERRKLIHPERATLNQTHGLPITSSDTVYLSVVDCWGNACSFINSNYMGFGTGIVPSGWGFTLQNRGLGFSLDAHHPNALMPGKRPYHTIISGLITRSSQNEEAPSEPKEELYACFGVMGGYMQPQGHVQVVVGLIDDGLDAQAVLDRPRFCLLDGEAGGGVALEEGTPVEVMSSLASMGHPVSPATDERRVLFGRGQVIVRQSENGVLWGGSDPRADGCAMTH